MVVQREIIGTPFEVVLGREDGRLVEVTIKAVGGGELTLEVLAQAVKAVTDRLRKDELARRTSGLEDGAQDILSALSASWQGKLTDRYLATLSVAYEAVSTLPGREIVPTLAAAIEKPGPTVKNHVQRARQDGWLTPTGPGKSGGHATPKAMEFLSRGLQNR